MKLCRVCMEDTDDPNFISIFESHDGVNIASTIAECCSIKMAEDDDLPHQICNSCVQDFKMFFAFVTKVRYSDAKLRLPKDGITNDSSFEVVVIKTESMDEDDNDANDNIRDNFDAEDVEQKSTSDSDDELLSCIKSKLRENKSAKTNLQNDKKVKRKRRTKEEIIADNKLHIEQDVLDDTEMEMFQEIILSQTSYVCCCCFQYFKTQEELDAHVAIHKKYSVKNTDTIFCEICKKRFSKLSKLNNHKRKAKTLSKLYECKKCNVRFMTSIARRRHASRHPETIEDKMKQEHGQINCCVQSCTKAFHSEELLIKHSLETHKLNKRTNNAEHAVHKPAECPVCFKRFSSEFLLRRHRKRNSRPLNHQCATCGLKFRTKDVLTFHEMNHAEQKPFQCDVCHKYFSSSNSLKVHLKRHADEKPYVCATCGVGFYQRSQLIIHEYDHTNAPLPFQCEVCEKSFKMKNGLVNHMRLHTGERPYPCRHCSMSFSNQTTRYRHEMNHTGNKPFKCSYCDKKFTIKRLQLEHECHHTG